MAIGGKINSIKKNTEAQMHDKRKLGPEVNREKVKYLVVSHHQNHRLLIANKSFENVAKFKYVMNNSIKSKLHTQRN
jgi:hypothetical protein